MKGAQREAAYRAVNPMMALPALIDGDGPTLFELLAIIEYLDETHPNPPLLPRDARGRARVRGFAQIVACDLNPLIVPRVREYLEHEFKLDEPTRIKWCQHWHTAALIALEAHLKVAATGRDCHGDAITLADICLASQAAGANSSRSTPRRFRTILLRRVEELRATLRRWPSSPHRSPGSSSFSHALDRGAPQSVRSSYR